MTKQWKPRLGAMAGAAIWACLLVTAGPALSQDAPDTPVIQQTNTMVLQTQDQPQSDPPPATQIDSSPTAPAPLPLHPAELPVGDNSSTQNPQEDRDPALPHDLSPMGMFLAADWVVKAVMIGLAFASVVTWTVLIVRLVALWLASGQASRACRRIEAAADLSAAVAASVGKRDPASAMISSAMQEYERSLPSLQGRSGDEGLKDRVASHVMQIEGQASRRISRGTGLLATIGSTAPFVGLFGTVWGIMNSFIGISQSQTTSLSVVAPGIAEALLATAMGLVAAIPAVVFYNVFARAITGYRLKLAAAGAGVQRLVSRDLDFRGV